MALKIAAGKAAECFSGLNTTAGSELAGGAEIPSSNVLCKFSFQSPLQLDKVKQVFTAEQHYTVLIMRDPQRRQSQGQQVL